MIDANLLKFIADGIVALEGRVHTSRIPQGGALPAAAIIRESGSTPRTLGGTRLFSRATFTIGVLGREDPETIQLANAVKDLLDGYKGTLTAPTELPGDTRVESARVIGEPTPVPFVDGDLVLLQMNQDVLVVFKDL